MNFNIMYFAAALPAIIVALALHEFGHAAMATKMGDPTPRLQGRLTLNPIAHLDPAGTVFIIITLLMGFGFGWGKPVQTNPNYYTDYRKGRILVALAGPAMNLCQAMVAVAFAFVMFQAKIQLPMYLHLLLVVYIIINIVLMVFNLLPIPPLDGGHVMEMILPYELAQKFRQYGQYGMLVLLGLMIFRLLGPIIGFFLSITSWLIASAFGDDFVRWLGIG